jgi:hypothetical protein
MPKMVSIRIGKIDLTFDQFIDRWFLRTETISGYVIVETIRMPPHHNHPYTNSPDWFEYSIWGPFETKESLMFILNKAESRESVKNGLVLRFDPKDRGDIHEQLLRQRG